MKKPINKLGSIKLIPVILSGGTGTRLWPLSRKCYPKQYLKIEDFDLESKKDYKIDMYEIPIGKTQVEAIKIIDSNTFWITSEDEKSSSSARLMKIKL